MTIDTDRRGLTPIEVQVMNLFQRARMGSIGGGAQGGTIVSDQAAGADGTSPLKPHEQQQAYSHAGTGDRSQRDNDDGTEATSNDCNVNGGEVGGGGGPNDNGGSNGDGGGGGDNDCLTSGNDDGNMPPRGVPPRRSTPLMAADDGCGEEHDGSTDSSNDTVNLMVGLQSFELDSRNIPPQALEEIRRLRQRVASLETENATLRARHQIQILSLASDKCGKTASFLSGQSTCRSCGRSMVPAPTGSGGNGGVTPPPSTSMGGSGNPSSSPLPLPPPPLTSGMRHMMKTGGANGTHNNNTDNNHHDVVETGFSKLWSSQIFSNRGGVTSRSNSAANSPDGHSSIAPSRRVTLAHQQPTQPNQQQTPNKSKLNMGGAAATADPSFLATVAKATEACKSLEEPSDASSAEGGGSRSQVSGSSSSSGRRSQGSTQNTTDTEGTGESGIMARSSGEGQQARTSTPTAKAVTPKKKGGRTTSPNREAKKGGRTTSPNREALRQSGKSTVVSSKDATTASNTTRKKSSRSSRINPLSLRLSSTGTTGSMSSEDGSKNSVGARSSVKSAEEELHQQYATPPGCGVFPCAAEDHAAAAAAAAAAVAADASSPSTNATSLAMPETADKKNSNDCPPVTSSNTSQRWGSRLRGRRSNRRRRSTSMGPNPGEHSEDEASLVLSRSSHGGIGRNRKTTTGSCSSGSSKSSKGSKSSLQDKSTLRQKPQAPATSSSSSLPATSSSSTNDKAVASNSHCSGNGGGGSGGSGSGSGSGSGAGFVSDEDGSLKTIRTGNGTSNGRSFRRRKSTGDKELPASLSCSAGDAASPSSPSTPVPGTTTSGGGSSSRGRSPTSSASSLERRERRMYRSGSLPKNLRMGAADDDESGGGRRQRRRSSLTGVGGCYNRGDTLMKSSSCDFLAGGGDAHLEAVLSAYNKTVSALTNSETGDMMSLVGVGGAVGGGSSSKNLLEYPQSPDHKSTRSLCRSLCAGEESFRSVDVNRPSFRQFLMLSYDTAALEEATKGGRVGNAGKETIVQVGSRYLDAFRFPVADVLDSYPTVMSARDDESTSSSAFDPKALSPFCLPKGVMARLIPKCCLRGASAAGWTGSDADRYQVLVFTDGAGMTSHGVAITIVEESDSPALVAHLSYRRRRRRAAVVINRAWRESVKRAEDGPRFLRQGSLRRQFQRVMIDKSISPACSPASNRTRLERQDSMSSMESNSNSAGVMARRGSIKNFLGGGGGPGGKRRRGTSLTRNTSVDSTCGRMDEASTSSSPPVGNRVSFLLDEFLRTSPVAKYDPSTKSGVWKSAKLKVKKHTSEVTVVIKHAALRGIAADVAAKYFDQERTRLMDLLRYEQIELPALPGSDEPRKLKVKAIRFVEVADDPSTPRGSDQNNDHSCSPNTDTDPFADGTDAAEANRKDSTDGTSQRRRPSILQKRALEAYESMLDAEGGGEICLLEKTYVLIGVEPSEQALLLAALQEVANSERKETTFDKTMCEILSDALECAVAPCSAMMDAGTQSIDSGLLCDESFDRNHLRHAALSYMQTEAKLNSEQLAYRRPSNEYAREGARHEKRPSVEMQLPLRKTSPLNLSLPLPQISKEWGLIRLLFRMDVEDLVRVLKLLLLERSLMVVGSNCEEVSACCCTFLDMLKPFEWESIFLPLLPKSMLDFVHSPVPFIVGMCVEGQEEVGAIHSDFRVQEALHCGMTIVNLDTGAVSIPTGCIDEMLILVPPNLSDTLGGLKSRLSVLTGETAWTIQSFIHRGLSRKESSVIKSIQSNVSDYMLGLSGAISGDSGDMMDIVEKPIFGSSMESEAEESEYDSDVEFRKEMASTQMFVGYVSSRSKRKGSRDANGRSPSRSSSTKTSDKKRTGG